MRRGVNARGGLLREQPYVFGHRPVLTQLRAVAVVMVLLFHAGMIDNGFLGVDVFFVLSGFLISNILWDALSSDEPRRVVITQFATKRAKRLLPLSVTVLAMTAIAAPLVFETLVDNWANSARASLLWIQNWFLIGEANDYFASEGANPFKHYWSLGIEEQFYIGLPLVMAAFFVAAKRIPLRWRLVAFGAVCAAGFAVAITLNAVSSESESYLYYATHLRSYQLLGGCLAMVTVRLFSLRSDSRLLLAVSVAGLLLLGVVPSWSPFELGLVATVLTWLFIVAGEKVELRARALTEVGVLSYGIYLWHFPFNEYLVMERRGLSSYLVFAIVGAASLALSAVSYRLIEEPVRRSALRPLPSLAFAAIAILGAIGLVTALPDGVDEEIYVAELTDADGRSLADAAEPAELPVDVQGSVQRLAASDVVEVAGWVPLVETSVARCGHHDTELSCVDLEG